MIRVLIVDDHVVVRVGLERLLQSFDDIEVVGAASSGEEAIRLVATTAPEVVLMDMAMPGIGGIAATERITEAHPDTKVVALSTHNDPHHVAGALGAGAHGYLVKDVGPDVLVAGIRSVVDGGAPLSPSVAAQLMRGGWKLDAPTSDLTQRELEVLQLIVDGFQNKQIAVALGISEKTVKSHCSRLFQRIGVSDRTQAAVWAERHLPEHLPRA
jgi:DNA-binding NarL/FixJ family response regulator